MTRAIGSRIRTLVAAFVACLLVAGSAGSARPDAPSPTLAFADTGPSPAGGGQMAPTTAVEEVVKSFSEMSLALVAVPDPRVPRHRRGYDLVVTALIKGMLDQGYVLDRYGFPWQKVLDGKEGGREGRLQTDCQFGVMLFRKDNWRDPGETSRHPSYRALYLIPETATEGLAADAMIAAMKHMRNQRHGERGTIVGATVCGKPGQRDATLDAAKNANVKTAKDADAALEPQVVAASGDGKASPMDAAAMAKSGEPDKLAESDARHKDKSEENKEIKIAYSTHAKCTETRGNANRVLLLGPSFSGSLNSLAQILRQAREFDDRYGDKRGDARSESKGRSGGSLKHGPKGKTDARQGASGEPDGAAKGESKGQVAEQEPLPGICAVSVSATAASNWLIERMDDSGIKFHSLAQSDAAKLAEIRALAIHIEADRPGEVAIFSEASSFGYEICGGLEKQEAPTGSGPDDKKRVERQLEDAKALCANAYRVIFPSNIADIRFERQKKADGERQQGLDRLGLSREHIALDAEGGNSSEYPDSQQTRLTAASNELELRRALRMLRNLQPKLIVVAATDVRDRLFLFDLLREYAGNAQLVDLETDILLSHPQYLHASRGAIAVGSERLILYGKSVTGDRMRALKFNFASTDYQNLLRSAIAGIDLTPDRNWNARFKPAWNCDFGGSDAPVLHAVGREGLGMLTCPQTSERWIKALVVPFLAMFGVLLIALSSPAGIAMMHRRRRRHSSPRFARLRARLHSWGELSVNASLFGMIPGALLLLLAAWLSGANDAKLLAISVLPPFCWAMSYQAGAYRHIGRLDVVRVPLRRRWWLLELPHPPMLLAILLLLGALLLTLAGHFGDSPLFRIALTRLGYSTTNGMAVGVAMIAAIMAMIFADSSLAIARVVSCRNRRAIVSGLRLGEVAGAATLFRRMFAVDVIPRSGQMFLGMLVLILCAFAALPLRPTVYGYWTSMLAYVAVIALSLVALSFLVNAIRMKRRTLHLAFVVRSIALQRPTPAPAKPPLRREDGKTMEKKPEPIGLWPGDDRLRVRFAATPAVARVSDAGQEGMDLLHDRNLPRLTEAVAALRPGPQRVPGPIEARTRVALYLIFASEVSQIRWATFSSAICSLTVAAFAYCFPVTGADWFVLFNLFLLAMTGLFAGHSATELERDEVLSNLLCNRTAKLEANSSLFRYVAFPFVLLAVMLAIMNVPGVMSWGDGLFKVLLDLVGGGGFIG